LPLQAYPPSSGGTPSYDRAGLDLLTLISSDLPL
jgi:hypothetical protein